MGPWKEGRLSPELAMLLGQEGQSGINKADGLMRHRVEGEKRTPRALISVTWISKRQRLTDHMHFAGPLKATRMDCRIFAFKDERVHIEFELCIEQSRQL